MLTGFGSLGKKTLDTSQVISIIQVTTVKSRINTIRFHSRTHPLRPFFVERLLYTRHPKFFLLL